MNIKKMGIILIILGFAALAIGIVLVIHKPKEEETNILQVAQPAMEKGARQEEPEISQVVQSESAAKQETQLANDQVVKQKELTVDEKTENEKKGLEFEKWVISKFPKKYYKIIDWKGDKIVDGRYAESSRYPDLELELSLSGSNVKEKFSVECKWRKAFYEGKINWASQEKIGIYNEYAKDRSQSVFLVLGVGGEPNAPERVYIIPLNQAQQSSLREKDIERFRRKETNKDFYYFAKKNTLS